MVSLKVDWQAESDKVVLFELLHSQVTVKRMIRNKRHFVIICYNSKLRYFEDSRPIKMLWFEV